MDKKALPIGVDSLENVIRNNYYYVDKSNLIKDLLDKQGGLIYLPVRSGLARHRT